MPSMVWNPRLGRYEPQTPGPGTSLMTVPPGGGGVAPPRPPGPPPGPSYPGATETDPYHQAWGIINPQLQAAADMINRRASFGAGAITDLTNVYSQRMAAASGMDVFGPEKKYLRGAADWGQSNLVGSGKAQQASLDAAAAQAGPGLTAGRDLNLKQEGKGAGGAAYGTGISWLDAQVAKEAAAATRSAMEPGFAAGMGQMQQGLLSAQLARQLADQQSQIQAQIPQLIDTLTEREYQHKKDTRDYAESVRQFNVALQAKNAASATTAGTAADKQAYQYAKDAAAAFTKNSDHLYVPRRTKTGWEVADMGDKSGGGTTKAMQHVTINGRAYTFNPNTGAYLDPKTGQPVVPTGKAGSPPKVNMPLSRARGQWVDASGNPIPGLAGQPPPFFKPGKGPAAKVPTDNQLNNMIQSWYQGKTSISKSTTGDKTTTTATTSAQPISYQQALQKINAMYKDPAARTHAVQLLNSAWKRGEGQRPWLDIDARQTLAKAKVRPAVNYVGIDFAPKDMIVNGRKVKKGEPRRSIPYLTPTQVKVLKAAGQLPPGAWAEDDDYGLGHVYIVRAGY